MGKELEFGEKIRQKKREKEENVVKTKQLRRNDANKRAAFTKQAILGFDQRLISAELHLGTYQLLVTER